MLDEKKAISDFENIEESLISPVIDMNDPAGTHQFDHEDLEELGFNLNKAQESRQEFGDTEMIEEEKSMGMGSKRSKYGISSPTKSKISSN